MVLANVAAAKTLMAKKTPSCLYAFTKEPSPASWDALRETRAGGGLYDCQGAACAHAPF